MGRADVYLHPDAKDPVLSESTVLAIAAGHTDLADATLEIDESGGEARVYLLSGNVVVKTQRPHRLRPRTSLRKEAALLEHLATSLGERVPRLFGYGHATAPEGEIEYLVLSRMPGRAAKHAAVTGQARSRLLHETGALLARMHSEPTDTLTARDGLFPHDADGTALRARLEAGFADLADLISERPGCWSLGQSPREVAKHALALIPASFTPVALHSNPGPSHVFCTDEGVLTGVIDFGDAYLSHPAMDLHTWPDPADRLALRTGYLYAREPGADFDAAWTAAMIYTDVAVIASLPQLAGAATADLTQRLAAS